jgi:hypothetical protein
MGSGASVRRRSACLRTRKAIQSLGLRVLQFRLPVFSQLNFGRTYGGITDQSGGVPVGARVTVVDVQRGVSRPLIGDSAGQCAAPSLTPGRSTVRAEATSSKQNKYWTSMLR